MSINKEQLKQEILDLVSKQKNTRYMCSANESAYLELINKVYTDLKQLHSLLDDYFYEVTITDKDIERLYNKNVANSIGGACAISGLNENTKTSIIDFAREIERLVKNKLKESK